MNDAYLKVLIILWLISIPYSYTCIYLIAKKLEAEKKWWAWVPGLHLLLACRISGNPQYSLLVLLIPYVGPISVETGIIFGLAQSLKEEQWKRYIAYVPIVNYVYLGYLALRKEDMT